MGLYDPLDGITNLKYKLLYFLTPNKKNPKRKALAFNWDRCCHLAICLLLILFYCSEMLDLDKSICQWQTLRCIRQNCRVHTKNFVEYQRHLKVQPWGGPFQTLRHLTKRHLTKRHLTKCHLTKRHLTKCHLTKRHLTKRHLTKRHMTKCQSGKRHLATQNGHLTWSKL